MARRLSARLALSLLARLAHRNEALAGDLAEQFRAGRSTLWLSSQLLMAILWGSFRQVQAPVALNLTPIDPLVAEWLMWRRLGPRKVTLGSPVEGVGGLGVMLLGLHLTTVVPDAWLFVFGGIFCGAVLGSVMAYRRRRQPLDAGSGIHAGQLKDLFV
jgi:hypothetical protein